MWPARFKCDVLARCARIPKWFRLFALQERAAKEGLVFIPPYDDPYIIAGQGTAGAEILRQLTSDQRDSLEAIFVAIGGGGLASGIAAYAKQLLPNVKVFGVEPTGARLYSGMRRPPSMPLR